MYQENSGLNLNCKFDLAAESSFAKAYMGQVTIQNRLLYQLVFLWRKSAVFYAFNYLALGSNSVSYLENTMWLTITLIIQTY